MWQQQLVIYQAAQAAAQGDAATAQARLASAKTQLGADQTSLATMDDNISAARKTLANTTIPADAQALVTQIAGMMIVRRTQQGTVLDDQDNVAEAQAVLDLTNARLSDANDLVKSATATILTVTTDDTRRQTLRTAVTSAPLATIQADATTYQGGTTATNAASRIGKNFPAALLTIAGDRYTTRATRISQLQTDLANAQAALGTEQGTDTHLPGASATAAITFDQTQAALTTYVATAADRFAKAKSVLAALEAIELAPANTVPDVLTAAELAQVTALTTAGALAQPHAVALNGDLQAIFSAQDGLATQFLASIVANVDTLPADVNITTKRAAITTAKNTFASDLTTFVAGNKSDLDNWEAVVPDTAWATLVDYETALADLVYLAGIDPNALATAMNNAEAAYATALTNQKIAERRVDALSMAVDFRQELLDAAQAALPTRLLSAIRGDSY
jgi:hypothetical protein